MHRGPAIVLDEARGAEEAGHGVEWGGVRASRGRGVTPAEGTLQLWAFQLGCSNAAWRAGLCGPPARLTRPARQLFRV